MKIKTILTVRDEILSGNFNRVLIKGKDFELIIKVPKPPKHWEKHGFKIRVHTIPEWCEKIENWPVKGSEIKKGEITIYV